MENETVIVTGASGWLGTGLMHALTHGLPDCPKLRTPRANLRIKALVMPGQDASSIKSLGDHVEVISGDVRNPHDCKKLFADCKGAVLLHAAGIIHPRRVSEFFDINLAGTSNILSAAESNGVRRAVVVSSNSPCGCNPHPDHLFDEESPYNPYMNYGRSKMLMELSVKQIQLNGKLQTVIIRAPWFYGTHQPPRQTLFFKMIRDGKGPIVGNGQNLRSMAYIDNLCQGILLAASSDNANGKTYWIADERPYSMNEIIDTIEQLLENEFSQKCARKRMRLPGIASDVAWLVDKSLQFAGLYHQKIHVLSEMNKTIACSVLKAKSELGYNPAVALEEGMRRSLKWIFDRNQWE